VLECLTDLRGGLHILDRHVWRDGDTAPHILNVKTVSGEGVTGQDPNLMYLTLPT